MKKEKIEINVNLEHLDFWRFYIYYYFNFNTGFYIFFSLVLFGFALLFMTLGGSFSATQLIGLFVMSFLFSIIFIFFLIYTAAENAVNYDSNAKYVISNNQIKVFGENYSTEIEWDYLNNLDEKNNYFFFRMKNGDPIMIPKRDFTNNEELLEFKALLKDKFKDEPYLKNSKGKLGLK